MKSSKKDKIKFFIILTQCIILTLLLANNVLSQDRTKKRGYKGKISKNNLIKTLKKCQINKKQFIEGYVIKGEDLIAIILNTECEINISNSIIEDVINFNKKISKFSLEKLNLPSGWGGKDKDDFFRKRQILRVDSEHHFSDIFNIVKNKILI